MSVKSSTDASASLPNLPDGLEYTDEFGPGVVPALPADDWRSVAGHRRSRCIVTDRGMHPKRSAAWLPRKDEHRFDNPGRPAYQLRPDLRAKSKTFPLLPANDTGGLPLLIGHNKHCDERNSRPINLRSANDPQKILNAPSLHFEIACIRYRIQKTVIYVEGNNKLMQMDDPLLLEKHEDAALSDDLSHEQQELGGTDDAKTFKNILHSHCHTSFRHKAAAHTRLPCIPAPSSRSSIAKAARNCRPAATATPTSRPARLPSAPSAATKGIC